MKKIFRKKISICILAIILVDVVIGYFLLTNRSFPRLAMWNIIESNKQDYFYWQPENAPGYFHFEQDSDRLSIFRNEISPLVKDEKDDFKVILKVAKYLMDINSHNIQRHLSLRWDSPEGILKQIRAGRLGNCFHYSILYSTYLSSLGMKSRLWTLEGDDKLEKLSHTVAEVYIEELKKWVLIDVSWGIYFTKEDYPLSVLELRDALLGREAEKILVHSVSERINERKMLLENHTPLLKSVFLRTGNDFVHKYDAKIRYGILSGFQKYLDRLPSVWRRGLGYLLGRQDFLIYYVDKFSESLWPEIIIARSLFYFFVISSVLIFVLFLKILMVKILRKSPLAISLSKKETRHR